MLVGREDKIVVELYLTAEVLATALFAEMNHLEMFGKLLFVHVRVLMVCAMRTIFRSVAETRRHVVRFRTIMEVDVPSHRDEHHQHCSKYRYGFQQLLPHCVRVS